MLNNIKIENILFLDIETVPAYSKYSDVPKPLQQLWDKKAGFLSARTEFLQEPRQKDKEAPEELYERAGIYAEFGKIICVSVGYVKNDNATSGTQSKLEFRTKSFSGDDERELLSRFIELLNNYYSKPHHVLCAHNGKEFDFPYLARRILINGLKLPKTLNIAGKKPWEIAHLDTMELWKFGDYKHYTSLNLLARIFNIQTPKDDIDGSDVARVYWKENDLDRIVNYCQKDVLTVVQLLLKFRGEPLIDETKVIITK